MEEEERIHIQLSVAKKGRRSGVINYSRTEVLELLHTLKAILPVDNFLDTARSVPNLQRKYSDLFRKQIPTGNPNCPKEVNLVTRVKWLIKGKEGVGDGEEPYNMSEGYQNNTEDKEYISSEEEDDGSDDDNIPPIPLQPTQPTQLPLHQPSQPTQEPIAINIPARIVPHSQSQLASSSSSSQRFVPSSPSPSSTLRSKRQYRRNTTNGRQDILDFLIENSKREREQRREDHWLEREHREAAFQAQRQQTEAA
eukprot:jgi/Psemu1/44279/gm1.44279_g